MKTDIQKFIADSEKNSADAGQLLREVAEINGNIAQWEADRKKAIDERAAEKTEYTATHKDYTESIEALEKAVMVLKQQNYNRSQKQAEALLLTLKSQLKFSSKLMSSTAMKKVDTYLALAQKSVQEYAQPLVNIRSSKREVSLFPILQCHLKLIWLSIREIAQPSVEP